MLPRHRQTHQFPTLLEKDELMQPVDFSLYIVVYNFIIGILIMIASEKLGVYAGTHSEHAKSRYRASRISPRSPSAPALPFCRVEFTSSRICHGAFKGLRKVSQSVMILVNRCHGVSI